MNTAIGLHPNVVNNGLNQKSTNLELRKIELRKKLNEGYKVNLRSNGLAFPTMNNLVGFEGLNKLLTLKEIEMLLEKAKEQTVNKKTYLWATGFYITLYVK